MEEENGKEADGSGLSESSEYSFLQDLGLRTYSWLSELYSQSLNDNTQKIMVSHNLSGYAPPLPPKHLSTGFYSQSHQ